MSNPSSHSLVGLEVPDFSLPATSGQTFRLVDLRGKPLVIYFYPKDSTPGCTTEAQQFRDLHADFQSAGGSVWGVSDAHTQLAEYLALAAAQGHHLSRSDILG